LKEVEKIFRAGAPGRGRQVGPGAFLLYSMNISMERLRMMARACRKAKLLYVFVEDGELRTCD
jgi:hypothetical protein